MSIPLVSFIAAACGGGTGTTAGTSAATGKAKAGGTIRTGIIAPAASLDPLKIAERAAWPYSASPAST